MTKPKPMPLELPSKVVPLAPAEPVEVQAVSQLGGTFAERAKAREATAKRINAAENKAVTGADKK